MTPFSGPSEGPSSAASVQPAVTQEHNPDELEQHWGIVFQDMCQTRRRGKKGKVPENRLILQDRRAFPPEVPNCRNRAGGVS